MALQFDDIADKVGMSSEVKELLVTKRVVNTFVLANYWRTPEKAEQGIAALLQEKYKDMSEDDRLETLEAAMLRSAWSMARRVEIAPEVQPLPASAPATNSSKERKQLVSAAKRRNFKEFFEEQYVGSEWGSDRTTPSDEALAAFEELVETPAPDLRGPYKVVPAFVPYFRILSVQDALDRDLAREEKKSGKGGRRQARGEKEKKRGKSLAGSVSNVSCFRCCL